MQDRVLASLTEQINTTWDQTLLPLLSDYIRIPNKSPAFDPDWEKHGYMEEAMALLHRWCITQPIKNMHCELLRLPQRTPLLFIDIPGTSDETVLLYGHMDKQPEMTAAIATSVKADEIVRFFNLLPIVLQRS